MVSKFSPGSSTKNFAWKKDPERLHRSIREGFGHRFEPVTREEWRKASKLNDADVELIPLNFFLYSKPSVYGDCVMVDSLVEFALTRPHDPDFAKLAVFAFNSANSGKWRNTDWPDGRVAGWANFLIRKFAWQHGDWTDRIFDRSSLLAFMKGHVEGKARTLQKMRNNYRFMLLRSGILQGDRLEKVNLSSDWVIAAPQLFWDRQVFDGRLTSSSRAKDFEDLFFEHEVHKLLRCNETQGRRILRDAFESYGKRLPDRLRQLELLDRQAA